MLLHLVHDEKIINRTIDVFEEALPGQNLFVVFTRHSFSYVKPQANVISFQEYSQHAEKHRITAVVIHYLNSRKIRFIKKYIDKKLPVYWIIWGNDLYNKLLNPKGFEIWDPECSYLKTVKKSLLTRKVNSFVSRYRANKLIAFISKRINYIVTDTTEVDYAMLLQYYPHLSHIPRKDFFYYPIDRILDNELMQKWVNGKNIQIGNSASMSNNHEYAMRFLSGLNLDGRQIVVPLSYSVTKEYVRAVKETGNSLFGDQFCPLEHFLPLDEYNRLMSSFEIVLYGNWRQEAIGNILISLYMGAKVFLPERSPVMQWAKDHQLKVYVLEHICQEEMDTPLEDSVRLHNRKILTELYSTDRLKSLIIENFAE